MRDTPKTDALQNAAIAEAEALPDGELLSHDRMNELLQLAYDSGRELERSLAEAEKCALAKACKPWEHGHGEPPEWESPLMLVWQAAIIWTTEQLAKALQVESFDVADGSETLEGDTRGTLLNVLRASRLDVDGDQHVYAGKLAAGLRAVAALIDDSRGVCGLHLNGDEASWDELRTGGRFEEWLRDFDDALASVPEIGVQWKCANGHLWTAPRFENGGKCPTCGTGAITFAEQSSMRTFRPALCCPVSTTCEREQKCAAMCPVRCRPQTSPLSQDPVGAIWYPTSGRMPPVGMKVRVKLRDGTITTDERRSYPAPEGCTRDLFTRGDAVVEREWPAQDPVREP